MSPDGDTNISKYLEKFPKLAEKFTERSDLSLKYQQVLAQV